MENKMQFNELVFEKPIKGTTGDFLGISKERQDEIFNETSKAVKAHLAHGRDSEFLCNISKVANTPQELALIAFKAGMALGFARAIEEVRESK